MTIPGSDAIADRVDVLRVRRSDPAAVERLTAIVRRRARDLDDAELLLDALGLSGGMGPAHVNTARYAHGSQAGVDWHIERGHASLCAACARWVEVRENRAERCAGGGCGTVNAYWSHRNAKEPTCEVSRAAYREYCRAQAAKGPAAR